MRLCPGRRPPECRLNFSSRSRWRFVLPNPHNLPTHERQMVVGLTITLNIATQLGRPPLPISLGPRSMIGAAVPEAPVHEHRNSFARKRQISTTTRKPRKWLVDAVPKTPGVEQFPQRNLSIGIACALARHTRRSHRVGRSSYAWHTSRLASGQSPFGHVARLCRLCRLSLACG